MWCFGHPCCWLSKTCFSKGCRAYLERFWSTLTFLCFGFGSGTASHLENTSTAPYGWLFVSHSCFDLVERCLPCLWLISCCRQETVWLWIVLELRFRPPCLVHIIPVSDQLARLGLAFLHFESFGQLVNPKRVHLAHLPQCLTCSASR